MRRSSCIGSKVLERKIAFALISFKFWHVGPDRVTQRLKRCQLRPGVGMYGCMDLTPRMGGSGSSGSSEAETRAEGVDIEEAVGSSLG
jgi:hypothetical protein